MQLDEIISNRRSIRKYKTKTVPKKLILKCLDSARLAPSACNSQPWHFVVFDDKKQKEDFANTVFSGIYKNSLKFKEASVIIAFISDEGNFTSKLGNFIKNTKFYLVDLGIACEHFVLKAHDVGLSTCWIGWFNSKKAKSFLKLPRSKKVDMLISVGYADEDVNPRPRKNLADIHSFNKIK